MANIYFKTLNDYYHWILSAYQSFSMCYYDTQALIDGFKIGYGIDGYDLCRYLFPKGFFKGKENPHHSAIVSTWQSFFEKTDPTNVFVFLSPFAVLEMLVTIEERASNRQLKNFLDNTKVDIATLVEQIKEGIRVLDHVTLSQQKVINTLISLMDQTKNARKIIKEGASFEKLNKLIESKKIRLIDPLIIQVASPEELKKLLQYDPVHLARGYEYLNDRRGKRYSEYSRFYNRLDVYHYVLFEHVDALLEEENINAYISSSGVLSRNSWMLTKYGKFIDYINGIPEDWAARSSDVPNFLTKACSYFGDDLLEVKYFFEEGRSLSRMILRELQAIPIMHDCIHDSNEREKIFKQNPIIEINNRIPHEIENFHNNYYRVLLNDSEKIIEPPSNIPGEIDIEALYEWIKNPETRGKEFLSIAEQVKGNIEKLQLKPINWNMYIAPLGESTYDVLRTFDPNIDL